MSSISYKKSFLPWVSFFFNYLALQKKSSVMMVPRLPAESARNLLTSGDSLMTTNSPNYPRGHGFNERQVKITKKLLNGCDEDGTNHQVAFKSWLQLPSTVTHHPQQSFSMADWWKQLCQPSSNLQTTMKQSEHPCNSGGISVDMMHKPRRDPLSYLPNPFG